MQGLERDIDINKLEKISIGLTSADEIREWSRGEVTKPETINYRTLRPEKDGLFCERIFGPSKDWECYCGKYKRIRFKGIICERCGVEVTRARVRRDRMGHIELAAPIAHVWFVKGVPSRMGYLLDISPKDLDRVLYFASSIVTWVDREERANDIDALRGQVEDEIRGLEEERDEEVMQTQALRTKRESVIKGESSPDEFTEDLAEIEEEEREATIARVHKEAEETVQDIQRSVQEQIDLVRRAWEEFQTLEPRQIVDDEELFREMRDRFGDEYGYGVYFRGGMGAEAVRDLIMQVDLEDEAEELREMVNEAKGQKRQKAIKRLKVVDAFRVSENNPAWMIMDAVPVLPPDLRPMVQLDGGRFATSDLNDLYRRVINRNNRLRRLLDLGAPDVIVNNEKRMLQEAVDALFDNGRRGRAVTGAGNRALKSLSDMLKGKQGRFRQNLLGKRVDYSGRSVIVVGPNLEMHQCGLPRLMAVELFKPFVMKVLVDRALAPNIRSAKQMVERLRPEVWDVLEDVIKEHPVLLNRAPTLHRLGIQAFEPVLVEGKAIQVHPLVCAAFNADFDGDQMAVHVPLSPEAQAEARVLMLSTQNILLPANGFPIAVPSQDMVLGLYYITYGDDDFDEQDPKAFISSYDEAEAAYKEGSLKIHDKVLLRRSGGKVATTLGRAMFNRNVEETLKGYLGEAYDPAEYEFVNETLKKGEIKSLVSAYVDRYPTELVSQLLDTLKRVGFHTATKAGVSIGKNDIVVPEQKAGILEKYDGLVEEVEEQWDSGFISDDERLERVIAMWTQAKNEVEAAMKANLYKLNPIFMMANSGARGNYSQITQLAGMRGLMTNTKGEIIDEPVKSNFMEGLSVLEYFTSTHGARKGQADTALRTADSGYLTRRLVDVSQDVVVNEADCGSTGYIDIPLYLDGGRGDANDSVAARFLARDLVNPETGEVVAEAGTDITPRVASEWQEILPKTTMVSVRTPSKCESAQGVCQACYGRALSTYRPVDVGEAVGIIAAQSIGEPGTQLTMRTFHTGGIAGEDITAGLPRVVELFEARHPKAEATLADIDGYVTLDEADNDRMIKVTLTSGDGTESRDYVVERQLLRPEFTEGAEVTANTPITEGSVYPHQILENDQRYDRGTTATERYIVEEVQKVYRTQGVDIHDKHIEVIVRQMLRKVVVDNPGDTNLLPEQVADKFTVLAENARVEEEDGTPATFHTVLMGITKASLATDSFLSAASFQETARVLTDAAIEGKVDGLAGLKENVIIGKLIPAATGMPQYRQLTVSVEGYGAREVEDLDIAAS
ncbi:DNA-directed RNA polymerase subunit beta' [Rubrobacter marinus]|uniref:DNA-directed RNA polymerase subunit beta' n=1 Tax=Rubrobacter marinus TaxID=2653852 RepID=A0A6G8PV57_9ACTN|nr:DNA-directed RNA polymerase subunit beta' [Rubrobacter marinus]QIN78074.1 DNA-directed RNA polymerase subunit beta' [Rubrobacter marinus]